MRPQAAGQRRLSALGAPLVLFAAALAIRALPWRTVLEGDQVLPYGSDALYHLRRIVYTAARFPASLDFDRYIHHPQGARPIWTPVFDWILALLLRPLASVDDPAALERAAMWVPPLLGAASVAALYLVARRNFGVGVAWLAAGSLCVMSGHYWYSQIGFLDHHAAVALCAVLLLGAGMAFVREPGRRGRAIGLGLAMAASLLLWPGSLLHVALVQAACAWELLRCQERGRARSSAAQLGLAHATAGLAVLPLAATAHWPQWGAFSPVVLGGFQPWWLGVCGLLAGICAWLWSRDAAGRSRARRVSSAGLVGLGLLLASAAVLPGLLEGAGDAWRWLARREVFQAQVAESQPLVWDPRGVTLSVALIRLSFFVVLFPLAWGFALRAARAPEAAPLRLFLVWSAGLLLATLAQRRFFNSFAIANALLLGWSGGALWRALRLDAADPRRRARARAGLGLVCAALLAPSLVSYATPLRNEWRAARGQPLEVSARRLAQRILLETADWLRLHTPETAGWLDPARVPEYGVLAPWEAGHAIEYRGRRPAVVDGFGDDLGPEGFALAGRYYRSSPREAAPIGEQLRIRYVVVSARSGFGAPAPGPGSVQRALQERDGSAGADGRFAALARHRIVYESRPARGSGRAHPSLYKVFEIVPGARIRGRAAPGERVELTLALQTNRGRAIAYRAAGRADAEGWYVFRVPYANRGGPPDVRVAPAYRLRSAGRSAELAVQEFEVAAGAERVGPDLRGAD